MLQSTSSSLFLRRRAGLRVVLILAFSLLSGCAYQGGEISPLQRKFSWFSYLNGDDFRLQCMRGQGLQARFVYNGVYTEQIRTYDLMVSPSPVLTVRVVEPANLSGWFVAKPTALMDPWAGKVSRTVLRDQDLEQLKQALVLDGVVRAQKESLELSSDDFYWLVSVCLGGEFHFAAYRWPSERFEKAVFPKLLRSWDMSEIAFNPPRETFFNEGNPHGLPQRTKFNLRADGNGLSGVSPLIK